MFIDCYNMIYCQQLVLLLCLGGIINFTKSERLIQLQIYGRTLTIAKSLNKKYFTKIYDSDGII